MSDDSIEANAIEIDHNAMLASDPSQNKAFLKIFGRFSGHSALDAPEAATQLSEIGPKASSKNFHRRSTSHTALKRLNEKLAARMQSQLTVADMIDKKTHLLPKKLRAEFVIDSSKKVLRKNFPSSNIKKSKKSAGYAHASSHGDISLAGKADDNLLSARQSHMTAAELVQQAAMKQMHQMHAAAPAVLPARPTQLAARPVPYQQYGYAAPEYATYAPSPALAQASPYQLPPVQQTLYRPMVSPQGYYPQQQPAYYAPAAAAPPAQYSQYPPQPQYA